jgi:hypothetical protein
MPCAQCDRFRLYTTVNVFLMFQSVLGHSIAMYVVFDMFFSGFKRKFTMRFPNSSKFMVDKGFRTFWVMVTCECSILDRRVIAVLTPVLQI